MTEEIHSAYQTLELPNSAGLPQVQKAWRKMVTVWHPDRFPRNPDLQREAEERAKQINNAYDVLKRYLKDGDIPRSRPRPSKQSRKQESQKQARQTRSRSSKQSQKQKSQKQTRQPRSRSSKQSQKQKSQQRTRQQETASEDGQSSQTDEQENRQEQTTKPPQEESLAAKNGEIIGAIIFGAIIGHFTGGAIVSLLDWMIEAVSGWSFIDRANLWSETFPRKTLIIVPLIVTFFSIAGKSIGSDGDAWFGYIFVGVCGGTIGGIIGNEMVSAGIATYIGVVFGTGLACSIFSEDES